MEKPDLIHIQWIRVPLLDLAMLRFYKLFGGVVFYTAHNVYLTMTTVIKHIGIIKDIIKM